VFATVFGHTFGMDVGLENPPLPVEEVARRLICYANTLADPEEVDLMFPKTPWGIAEINRMNAAVKAFQLANGAPA